jgi:hypothetical protein
MANLTQGAPAVGADAEITEAELKAGFAAFVGEDIDLLPADRLLCLLTLAQYSADVLLNEVERRGMLELSRGAPCVPYVSDYMVETILTRDGPSWPGAFVQ